MFQYFSTILCVHFRNSREGKLISGSGVGISLPSKYTVNSCIGLPEQALGWFQLGLRFVVEDKPSVPLSTCYIMYRVIAQQ